MTVGSFIRVMHDGSWSMWKCTKCGKIVYCKNYEQPKECDCEKDGDTE